MNTLKGSTTAEGHEPKKDKPSDSIKEQEFGGGLKDLYDSLPRLPGGIPDDRCLTFGRKRCM